MPAIELDGQKFEFDSEDNLKTFVTKYAQMKGISSSPQQAQPQQDSLLKKAVKQVVNTQPFFGGLNALGDIGRFVGGEQMASISQQPTQTGSSLINEITAENTVAPAAFVRGLGGTALFGQTPRIGALAEMPFSEKDYSTLLQEQIQKEEELGQKAPISKLIGNVGGLFLPTGVPGLISKGVSKAIPALKEIEGGSSLLNLLKGAGRSAVEGAIGGAAYEAAQPQSTTESTAREGIKGSLFGLGGNLTGKFVNQVSNFLGDMRFNYKDIGKIINNKIGPTKSVNSLYDKSIKNIEDIAPKRNSLLDKNSSVAITPPVIKSKDVLRGKTTLTPQMLRDEASNMIVAGDKDFLNGIADKIETVGSISPREATTLKTILNDLAYTALDNEKHSPKAKLFRQFSSDINKQIFEKIPDVKDKYAFRDFNKELEAFELVKNRSERWLNKPLTFDTFGTAARGILGSVPGITSLHKSGNILQSPGTSRALGAAGSAILNTQPPPKKQVSE